MRCHPDLTLSPDRPHARRKLRPARRLYRRAGPGDTSGMPRCDSKTSRTGGATVIGRRRERQSDSRSCRSPSSGRVIPSSVVANTAKDSATISVTPCRPSQAFIGCLWSPIPATAQANAVTQNMAPNRPARRNQTETEDRAGRSAGRPGEDASSERGSWGTRAILNKNPAAPSGRRQGSFSPSLIWGRLDFNPVMVKNPRAASRRRVVSPFNLPLSTDLCQLPARNS